MAQLIPNVNSKTFTISAAVVGFLLIDDLTPAEQNSLGNWFMLLAQVLCTNAAQQQLLNNRKNTDGNGIVSDKIDNVNMLEKTIQAMQQEINNLKIAPK